MADFPGRHLATLVRWQDGAHIADILGGPAEPNTVSPFIGTASHPDGRMTIEQARLWARNLQQFAEVWQCGYHRASDALDSLTG